MAYGIRHDTYLDNDGASLRSGYPFGIVSNGYHHGIEPPLWVCVCVCVCVCV